MHSNVEIHRMFRKIVKKLKDKIHILANTFTNYYQGEVITYYSQIYCKHGEIYKNNI